MRGTFGRIFPAISITLIVMMVLLGSVYRLMLRNYLVGEQTTALRQSADAVTELTQNYIAGDYRSISSADDTFHTNLAFSARVADVDTIICNAQGKVILCSCQELRCEHIGMIVEESFLNNVLQKGARIDNGIIDGLYRDNRYIVSEPLIVNGVACGMVMASTPVKAIDSMLASATEMFVLAAMVVLLVMLILLSIYTGRQIRPLNAVANAAREFSHGNLKARVVLTGKISPEMEALGSSFNNMAESLEHSEYQRQEFVANVSHELKTPMTTIAGYVDGLLDGTIPKEKQRQYLTIVSDEVKRLSRLVRSMLDISKLQDQQSIPVERMSRFDISELAGQVLLTFEHRITEKDLDVQVDFPEHPFYALADKDSINQVIYNLLDNAVKFVDEKGTLGLSVRGSGSKLYITVSNTGNTIPPEELPLVFDRFHKIDKSRSRNSSGWGLGLYIVKSLVNFHGENISVESRDGNTSFTFTLKQVP